MFTVHSERDSFGLDNKKIQFFVYLSARVSSARRAERFIRMNLRRRMVYLCPLFPARFTANPRPVKVPRTDRIAFWSHLWIYFETQMRARCWNEFRDSELSRKIGELQVTAQRRMEIKMGSQKCSNTYSRLTLFGIFIWTWYKWLYI